MYTKKELSKAMRITTENNQQSDQLRELKKEADEREMEKVAASKRARPATGMTFSGRLLLDYEYQAVEAAIRAFGSQLTVTAEPGLTQSLWQRKCHRCGNTDSALFGQFPCAVCEHTVAYCKYCLVFGRVTRCTTLYHISEHHADRPQTHASESGENEAKVQVQGANLVFSTGMQLKDTPIKQGKWVSFQFASQLSPRQQFASDRIVEAIQTGLPELLVYAVCGAGKTEMLFYGILEALRSGKRVALASPRADVVRELYPRFTTVFTEIDVLCHYGGSNNHDQEAPLTLLTTHQLIRYKQAFDVLVIDEVDAFPFHNDPVLIQLSKRALKTSGTMIYLTATPRKAHLNEKLPTVFVPSRFHNHPLPVPDSRYATFTTHHLPKRFFHDYAKHQLTQRQLLIFVPTVSVAAVVEETLRKQLPKTTIAAVHANDCERIEKVTAFRLRHTDVLITTTILERGVTFPSVNVFVFQADHHVFDEAALVQIAGRAGRSPHDPTGMVIFYHRGTTRAIKRSIRAITAMNARCHP
ncbi:DEAD/DEAH box helicase [Streptohalobacillus salinus]|nr:DEAD/DEAH box helicase [Streptohalobacillus salinus]